MYINPYQCVPQIQSQLKGAIPRTSEIRRTDVKRRIYAMRTVTFPAYNVIRWPNADGAWWLVSEASETSGYAPIRELHPSQDKSTPTYSNQLWAAAELLADKGVDALNNPHAMIGRECGCSDCFCCAAAEIVKAVR